MADPSGPAPQFPHGGEQYPVQKMPSSVPNGLPPQWGQDENLKSTLTSQSVYPATTTNGTRNSSQHSHPGSLSSHSSRDSSPAPSRIGVVRPNVWSPLGPQNHSNSPATEVPTSSPSQSSPFNTAVNHTNPAVSTSSYQPHQGQRMPPIGQVPPRPQHLPPSSAQSSMPAASLPIGSIPTSTLGPSVPQMANANSLASQHTSQSQSANLNVTSPNIQHGMQTHGVSLPSNVPQQNSFGSSQYSQASPNQQAIFGQQHTSVPGQRSLDPTLPRASQSLNPGMQGIPSHVPPVQQSAPGRMIPPGQSQHMPSGPGLQTHQAQEMSLNPGQPMLAGQSHQIPQRPGQHPPVGPGLQTPSSGLQMPPGAGSQIPQGPGQQMPPIQGRQMPPSFNQPPLSGPGSQMHQGLGQQISPSQTQKTSGQMMPPGVSPQGLPSTRPIPPGPGQQVLAGASQQRPHGSGSFLGQQLQSGVSQQLNAGPQAIQRQLPPGQLPHMQGPPLPGQWSSTTGSSGAPPRAPYPSQQGPMTAPPQAQLYNSAQQTFSQPNQALSGPPQRGQPGGQFIPNQNYPAQPLTSQAPGVGGDMGFRRYPQHVHPSSPDSLTTPMSNLSVTQAGFNKLWGQENYDLIQNRNILPPEKVEPPAVRLTGDFQNSINCSPDIFCCTLTRIPETDSLLKKSRLPLGVLIHPFKDLHNLPVIQCTPIVRCRVCRTYINPFVYFMDEKHWKCNLCYRVNDLPDEFNYDPATKTYGEPMRRPEVKSSTIEFIAPAEYMLRPPQPAVYLFLLDVSRLAVESGYLQLVCETLMGELGRLPGDSRTSVGFITYDSSIHFYSLAEGLSAPQQMVVMDIDDVFLPCPENLLANLGERRELIQNMLLLLPSKFSETYDTGSALGAALQAAFKLMSPTGGRVTVFQCCLPNKGPGALKAREDPANRASKDVPHLNPATDFYKQLALEFSGQQTAVDLFLLNQQYSDLATISGVSRFSGGCIYHFPLFQSSNLQLSESFENAFRRYLDRKIGFEAVMRIRCSRGLSIHTFHGNFYVRSTDLLSLPNINPDAGFGMQVSIEENLSDMQTVCFQAALLYTSGKGERRIRVHTLCLPIAASLPDILHSADQQCIIGLLAKMAVDRSQQSSLSDARDAFVNVVIDALSAYKATQSSVMGAGLLAPRSLRLLPLYILALLKNTAFRSGTNTRLDDRVYAMCQMKTLSLNQLIQFIYPDLYPVHCLDQYEEIMIDNVPITIPPRLHLSAEKTSTQGAFLMDSGDQILILVGRSVPPIFCENVLGVSSFNAIPEDMYELPEVDCEDSRKLRNFLSYLQSEKPYSVTLHVIREDSKSRSKFFDRLLEDRTESSLSYYEFLQHIKNQIK